MLDDNQGFLFFAKANDNEAERIMWEGNWTN